MLRLGWGCCSCGAGYAVCGLAAARWLVQTWPCLHLTLPIHPSRIHLTGRKVENFLNRTLPASEGTEVLPHHAAIADERRDVNLRRFLAAPESITGGYKQRRAASEAEQRLVLVCTDRASRGMDSAFVEHVVLFDLPRDPSEYLRRVGRTTRGAGGSGVVSVLALGRQVKLAKEIIDRNQGGLALHRIPAALPTVATLAVAGPSNADRVAADLAAVPVAAPEAEQQEQHPEQQPQEQTDPASHND